MDTSGEPKVKTQEEWDKELDDIMKEFEQFLDEAFKELDKEEKKSD